MKQHKEIEEPNLAVEVPSRSYHAGPPETVTLKATDLEGSIPREHLLRPLPAGQAVVLPAAEIFLGNVPKISLTLLARLLPGVVAPAETVIALPAARVAVAYGLVGREVPGSGVADDGLQASQDSVGDSDAQPAKRQGFFSALPIFRRKPAHGPRPSGDPVPARADDHLSHEPSPAAADEQAVPEVASAEPQCGQGLEIVGQEALQALLLVDETLTQARVVELCSKLPGIRSCALMRGPAILAAHAVPEGLDPVPIGTHAAELFWTVGESSARMGLGIVESVTLFTAERGAVSLLHNEGLTMVVLHLDRGFAPGVREKLAAVLHELSRGRPAAEE